MWAEPLNVLIVDDREDEATFVEHLLRAKRSSRILTTCVRNYDAALRLLASESFDVAIVDYRLGSQSGLDVIREVRRCGCETPCIVLTNETDPAVDMAAMEAGAADFLYKGDLTTDGLERALRYAVHHHRALQLLRQREEHFRALIQNLSDAILLWDAKGTIRFASESFTRTFGISLDEVVGMNAFTGFHPEDLGAIKTVFSSCVSKPRSRVSVECRCRDHDGAWRDQELVAVNRLDDPAVRAIVVTYRDITERKRAELALRRKVDQLNAIVSRIPMSVWALDPEGVFTFSQGQLLKRFGLEASALDGKPILQLLGRYPDLCASTRRALAGDEVHDTLRVDEGLFEVWYSPIVDRDGSFCGTIGVAVDVTERAVLEEQLRQSQKIEAIGRLAGGVAHDFNNLLTAIIGYSDLAAEQTTTANLKESLEGVQRAANTAAGLTKQLLAFSRRQLLQPQFLQLNRIVADMEPLLRRLIGENISLTISLEPELASINADPHQLEQILMNLVVNARDAMPQGGELKVATSNICLDRQYVATHRGATAGPHVLLSVTDTGAGMPPEVQDRLFEPFFTTKERGRGTGLGLATVYGIVKQSGGYISVSSQVGLGTTFEIFLPVSKAAATTSPTTSPSRNSFRGTETILVVDDQQEVREVASQMLRRLGYQVIEADGPREAIALMTETDAPVVDVLFTDMVMPEMNGRALARLLQEGRPELRVLYTSGYSDDAIETSSDMALLPKPFTAKSLGAKIREVLNAPTGPML